MTHAMPIVRPGRSISSTARSSRFPPDAGARWIRYFTDSKPRQIAGPLQSLSIALIQLEIAVDRLDHPNAGGPIEPLQVAKRAIRVGRALPQMPSSLFTSSEV